MSTAVMTRRAFDTHENLADQLFRCLETPYSDVREYNTVPLRNKVALGGKSGATFWGVSGPLLLLDGATYRMFLRNYSRTHLCRERHSTLRGDSEIGDNHGVIREPSSVDKTADVVDVSGINYQVAKF